MLQKFSGEHVPSWGPVTAFLYCDRFSGNLSPLHQLCWTQLQSLRLLWQRKPCSVATTACGGDHVGLGGPGKLELGGPVPKAGGTVPKRGKNLSQAPGHCLGYKCSVSLFSRPYRKIPNSDSSVDGAVTWIQAQTRQSAVWHQASYSLLWTLLPSLWNQNGDKNVLGKFKHGNHFQALRSVPAP